MALLKSGSTVGGNLIWHQGLLPVFPSGNSLYYKDYKVYTENDKPTPTELNVFDKNQISKFMAKFDSSGADSKWYKLGVVRLNQGGQTLRLELTGGSGYNGTSGNNPTATMVLRTGNASTGINTAGRLGVLVTNTAVDGNPVVMDVAVIESANQVYDLYVLFSSFSQGVIVNAFHYDVAELSSVWEYKGELQSAAPVGTQNVKVTRAYTTGWKPTNADVGLGNVTNVAQVNKAGDTMTGKLIINYTGGSNNENVLGLSSGVSAAPLLLRKPGTSNYNISIGFNNDAYTRYLGVGPNQELRWGNNLDQGSNAKVYTTEFKPTAIEINAFHQATSSLGEANLNDVVNPGNYYQSANAQALGTRNYPLQVAGALTVYDTQANGWGRIQEYRPFDRSQVFTRNKTNATTWSGWSRLFNAGDLPTYQELQVVPNGQASDWNLVDGYIRRMDGATGGPEAGTTTFGIHCAGNAGVYATQIAGRDNRFYMRSRENGVYRGWMRLYHTGYKPTNADVGLGNVSNVAQVNKAGDTMSGELKAPTVRATNASFYSIGDGNSHLWFQKNDGTEKSVIYAQANGQLNIRTNVGRSVDFRFVDAMIQVGANTTGSDKALIRGTPDGGAFVDWQARSSGLQIDCPNSHTSAYNVWKATKWGTSHIASWDVHMAGDNYSGVTSIYHNGAHNFTFGGSGFSAPGDINAGINLRAATHVYSGGGASYLRNDGEIGGAKWNSGILSTHIEDRAAAWARQEAGTIGNRINAECITAFRLGGIQQGWGGNGAHDVTAGWVVTGMDKGQGGSTGNGTIQLRCKCIQVHVPNRGWVNAVDIWGAA